jgi:hypothetical protein
MSAAPIQLTYLRISYKKCRRCPYTHSPGKLRGRVPDRRHTKSHRGLTHLAHLSPIPASPFLRKHKFNRLDLKPAEHKPGRHRLPRLLMSTPSLLTRSSASPSVPASSSDLEQVLLVCRDDPTHVDSQPDRSVASRGLIKSQHNCSAQGAIAARRSEIRNTLPRKEYSYLDSDSIATPYP